MKRYTNNITIIIFLIISVTLLISCSEIKALINPDSCNYYGDRYDEVKLKADQPKSKIKFTEINKDFGNLFNKFVDEKEFELQFSKIKQKINKTWIEWSLIYIDKKIVPEKKDLKESLYIIASSKDIFDRYTDATINKNKPLYMVNVYCHFMTLPDEKKKNTLKKGDNINITGYIHDIKYYPDNDNLFIIILQYSALK